jgi:hypothetical protein
VTPVLVYSVDAVVPVLLGIFSALLKEKVPSAFWVAPKEKLMVGSVGYVIGARGHKSVEEGGDAEEGESERLEVEVAVSSEHCA